jgi:hypothetical protein
VPAGARAATAKAVAVHPSRAASGRFNTVVRLTTLGITSLACAVL